MSAAASTQSFSVTRGSVSASDPQLRRAFWGVMASFIVHGLVVSTWVSRIQSIKANLALSDGALGLALLGTAIGSVIAIPICGALVTRFGSRPSVTWTGIGLCSSLLFPGLAVDTTTLFAALLFYGAMAGANDVAMNAQAVATEKLLGFPAMSRFHAMFSFGGILGASAGGFIASRGVTPFVHLTFGALLFVGIAIAAPRFMVNAHVAKSAEGPLKKRRFPLTLIALSAIGFCIFLSEGAIADWAGVFLRQVLRTSDGFAPLGYAVFSVTMAAFRFRGDAITARIGREAVIRYGGLLAAAGVGLAICASSPYVALLGFAAAGAGFSSIIPNVFAASGRVSGVSEGAGVATVSGLGYLGFLAGPPAIGFLSQISSLRVGLLVLVILSAAAALLAGAVRRISD